jgi:hypothetical protein
MRPTGIGVWMLVALASVGCSASKQAATPEDAAAPSDGTVVDRASDEPDAVEDTSGDSEPTDAGSEADVGWGEPDAPSDAYCDSGTTETCYAEDAGWKCFNGQFFPVCGPNDNGPGGACPPDGSCMWCEGNAAFACACAADAGPDGGVGWRCESAEWACSHAVPPCPLPK